MLLNTQAWWETGHMLVAQIAKNELLARNPAVYARAENITLFLKGLTSNLSDSFVESAVWLDDIKNDLWDYFFGWHFVDRPVDPFGINNGPLPTYDSLYAVNESMRVLNCTTTLGNTTLTKSIYLRVLMHVVGDMHQPLHNADYFNNSYLRGDQGGNLENTFVESANQTMPLHSFWDSVGMMVPNNLKRPLTQESQNILEQLANNITQEYSRAVLQDKLDITDVNIWTISIYADAVNFAYKPLRSDFVIDASYQAQAYAVMKRNIALGGYRLADLITQALQAEVPTHDVNTEKIAAYDDGFLVMI